MELQRITIWIILGTILLIQTSLAVELDNGGGGTWQENITFYLKSATAEYGHYKIVIDESACKIYNVMGDVEACQPNGNFWSLVQSDGEDIRVYNHAQLYFWIEKWDYANKTAVIWVNISAGSEELNIAYGNPSATESDYENGEQVFEFFDDFEGDSLKTEWTQMTGSWTVQNGYLVVTSDYGSAPGNIILWSARQFDTTKHIIESRLIVSKTSGLIVNAQGLTKDSVLNNVDVNEQSDKLSLNEWDGSAWKTETHVTFAVDKGDEVYVKVWQEGDTINAFVRNLRTGTEATHSRTVTYSSGYIGLHQGVGFTDSGQFDWVRVLKLADPADFYTQGGEPETNTTHIVSFKVYRCFKPVKNVPVKVKYKGKLVCCGYTDDTGSIAFRLDKLKTYEIDINKSEKIVTIQPLENNYVITLPCNITMEGETATYNQTFGNYTWDLLKIGQDISSQLSPSARGFLSGILAWLLMYGTSSLGLTSPVPGIIALAGLAVVGFTDWIVVLLCTMFSVGMYIIRRNLS